MMLVSTELYVASVMGLCLFFEWPAIWWNACLHLENGLKSIVSNLDCNEDKL